MTNMSKPFKLVNGVLGLALAALGIASLSAQVDHRAFDDSAETKEALKWMADPPRPLDQKHLDKEEWRAVIGHKESWPSWTPTANMMRAMPHYRAYASGMAGGTENPLGARALYLYRDGEDTYFRLHGTNEPDTIGTAVSSGCIRLVNQDIIDLYNRVPVGAPVVVLQTRDGSAQ